MDFQVNRESDEQILASVTLRMVPDYSGMRALQATAEKIRIGKKAKKFTYAGGTNSFQSALRIVALGVYPHPCVENSANTSVGKRPLSVTSTSSTMRECRAPGTVSLKTTRPCVTVIAASMRSTMPLMSTVSLRVTIALVQITNVEDRGRLL